MIWPITIYSKMDTFQDIQVKPYCPFEEDKNEDKELAMILITGGMRQR